MVEIVVDEPQRQRFEHGYRLVAGCVPYQLKQGSPGDNVRILMISSVNGHGLVFPKGGWEFDETVEDAACREAVEEAGVRGQIKEELGHWIFASKRHDMVCTKGNCKAYMFALEVTQELETWPEQEARRRQWFTIATAIEKVRHAWMREALEKFREYLQQQQQQQQQQIPVQQQQAPTERDAPAGSKRNLTKPVAAGRPDPMLDFVDVVACRLPTHVEVMIEIEVEVISKMMESFKA